MNEKNEALRLADMLEKMPLGECDEQAAAELRRLHDEVESLRQSYNIVTDDCRNLTEKVIPNIRAQRDALLEALKKAEENGCATVYANEDDEYGERGCCGVASYMSHADDCWVTMARAAIKAAEEGK